ncbi:MAG: putative carbon monoxide dehydrogenase accessory protein [Ilumatobacteraceae bacterium]|nr:putative carbon monoxide dehydrogenase accessory protein [Ilumatobacteraceae bacterium]MCU1392003.1 putative carbon monoxide dehydrogenase accessory protein [Ilumatobacteraceae bacterium]
MELVNEFTVNRPIDEAWAVLTDVERIAPCLPGAQLQEIEGDIYRGVVKVKVGPITAALKGEASFVERDDENHRAVLKGDGRDIKGNGNASALITATLEEISPTSAKCVVHTDLNMTGKVAQFGRGALADISGKLMAQFATNLDEMLAKDAAGPPATAAAEPTSDVAAEPTTETPSDAAEAETANADTTAPAPETGADPSKPTTRIINGPAAEPIDAFSLGGTALLKRLLPVFGGIVVLLLALSRARKK